MAVRGERDATPSALKKTGGVRVSARPPPPPSSSCPTHATARTGMRSGYLSRMRAASACRFSEEERGRRQHWGGEGGAGKKAHRPSLLYLSARRARPASGAQGGRGGLAEGRGDTLPPGNQKHPPSGCSSLNERERTADDMEKERGGEGK